MREEDEKEEQGIEEVDKEDLKEEKGVGSEGGSEAWVEEEETDKKDQDTD